MLGHRQVDDLGGGQGLWGGDVLDQVGEGEPVQGDNHRGVFDTPVGPDGAVDRGQSKCLLLYVEPQRTAAEPSRAVAGPATVGVQQGG